MRLMIVIFAAVALSAGPAAAKQKHRKARPVYETARISAGVCQPMCSFDMTPCDPPEYKRTDGRCSSPVVGGTQVP